MFSRATALFDSAMSSIIDPADLSAEDFLKAMFASYDDVLAKAKGANKGSLPVTPLRDADGVKAPVAHEDDDLMDPHTAPTHFPASVQKLALYKRSPEFRQAMHEGYYQTHFEAYKKLHFDNGNQMDSGAQRLYGAEPSAFQRERKQQGAKLGDNEGMSHPNSKFFPRHLYKVTTETMRHASTPRFPDAKPGEKGYGEAVISPTQARNVIWTGKQPQASRKNKQGKEDLESVRANTPATTGELIRTAVPAMADGDFVRTSATTTKIDKKTGAEYQAKTTAKNPGSIKMAHEGRLFGQSGEADLVARGLNRAVRFLQSARKQGKTEFFSNARLSPERLEDMDTNPLASLGSRQFSEQWKTGTKPRSYADGSVDVTGRPGKEGSLVLGGQKAPKFRQGAMQMVQQFLDNTGTEDPARAEGKKYRNQMSGEVGRTKRAKAIDRMMQGEW